MTAKLAGRGGEKIYLLPPPPLPALDLRENDISLKFDVSNGSLKTVSDNKRHLGDNIADGTKIAVETPGHHQIFGENMNIFCLGAR